MIILGTCVIVGNSRNGRRSRCGNLEDYRKTVRLLAIRYLFKQCRVQVNPVYAGTSPELGRTRRGSGTYGVSKVVTSDDEPKTVGHRKSEK